MTGSAKQWGNARLCISQCHSPWMQKNAHMQSQEKPATCNNANAKRGSHMGVGFTSLIWFGWTNWLLLTHATQHGACCTTQMCNGQGWKNFRHKRLPRQDFQRSPELDRDQSAHTIEKHLLSWRSWKNHGPRHKKTHAESGSITMFDVRQTHTHKRTRTQTHRSVTYINYYLGYPTFCDSVYSF